MSAVAVSAPGSSANLGSGFDVFGMALDMRLTVGVVGPATDASADDRHPAVAMYRLLGGRDALWVRSAIPMGRGLGFSGAARVAGAALAVAQRDGELDDDGRAEILGACAAAEGHADNAAASLFGGIVVVHDTTTVPLRLGPRLSSAPIVVWVPASATSTARSRLALPDAVELGSAVHNVGAAACLVAAVEHDAPALLGVATSDRLHQDVRLARRGDAAVALAKAVDAGAWCSWLSGSGPSVAAWVDPADVDRVVRSLGEVAPDRAHVKVVAVDRRGLVVDHS